MVEKKKARDPETAARFSLSYGFLFAVGFSLERAPVVDSAVDSFCHGGAGLFAGIMRATASVRGKSDLVGDFLAADFTLPGGFNSCAFTAG